MDKTGLKIILYYFVSVIVWLQGKSREFLTDLPSVAQDLMSAPATSVPSERTFSISGILSENRMASISPTTLENRVIVKCNKLL